MTKRVIAKLVDGEFRCPKCGHCVAKASYGAHASAIEIKCKCRRPVMLELQKKE